MEDKPLSAIDRRLRALERQVRRSQRINRALAVAVLGLVCFAGAQRTPPATATPAPPSQRRAPESENPTPPATQRPAPSPRSSDPQSSDPRSSESSDPRSSEPTPERQTKDRPQSPGDLPERFPDDRAAPEDARLRSLTAGQFVLLDDRGRPRARLAMSDGGPALRMYDEQGRTRLELSHTARAAGLQIFDSHQNPLVALQAPNDASAAHLEIRSPHGRTLTRAAGVSIEDSDGQGRLLLALINGNFPVLGISQSGQNGPASVELTASDNGARAIKLHNADGQSVFSATTSQHSASTHVSLRHPDHERSLQISLGPPEQDGPLVAFSAPARADGGGGLLPFLKFGLRRDRRPFIQMNDGEGNAWLAP